VALSFSTIGIMSGFYVRAAQNITVDVSTVTITSYNFGGTLFYPTMDVNLKINGEISNPTAIAVKCEYALFEISMEGIFLGIGRCGEFTASNIPSSFETYIFLDDLGSSAYLILADFFIANNSKTVNIHLTAAKTLGIEVPSLYFVALRFSAIQTCVPIVTVL